MKKEMTREQVAHLRGDFSIVHTCKECQEVKPVNAFTYGSGGLCNVCKAKRRNTDQAFIDRKNKVEFDRDIRRANSEYDWPSDKQLNRGI